MIPLWVILFILCGCDANNYNVSTYIEETKLLFNLDDINVQGELDQPLLCKQMLTILEDVSHEDKAYLFSFGIIDESMYEQNIEISKEMATKMNQRVYNDLYEKQYTETVFHIDDITSVNDEDDIDSLNPGTYVYNHSFFEITEDGNIQDYQVETFDLKSSFVPRLDEGIILPANVEITSLHHSSITDYSLERLRSRFFKFDLKGYQVSGSVSSTELQINVSKKTNNDFKIENELSLSDLKCHCDLSLEEKDFYFRVDYNLKNKLKVSKTKTTSVKNKESILLDKLKEKIQALAPALPIVENELHLLSFQFEVPSTGKLVSITMDISLKMFVNGEAEVIVKASNKHGSQSFQDSTQPLSQQKFEVEPRIEGSVECAAVLNFDLKFGNLRIVDVASHLGVGAEAVSSIHYVDKTQKQIETEKRESSILDLETLINQYQLANDTYIDMCQDVNVYFFSRLQANQKQSLLRNLGLYGSYTPFKENISLLHIENHRQVDSCTKNEILYNPKVNIEPFDISNYQLHLSKGETAQITVSKASCDFSSTDNDIVFVDEKGAIYAKNIGHATIIVKDENGYERRCLVIVN